MISWYSWVLSSSSFLFHFWGNCVTYSSPSQMFVSDFSLPPQNLFHLWQWALSIYGSVFLPWQWSLVAYSLPFSTAVGFLTCTNWTLTFCFLPLSEKHRYLVPLPRRFCGACIKHWLLYTLVAPYTWFTFVIVNQYRSTPGKSRDTQSPPAMWSGVDTEGFS